MLRRPSRLLALATVVVAGLLAPGTALAAGGPDWSQFGHDAAHSGVGPDVSAIGPSNVASLQRSFAVTLPDTADAPPVSRSGVSTPSGVKDLLFLNTLDGYVLARDAATGAAVWQQHVSAGGCRINNGSQPCYTTSAPAVDPSGAFVYAYGLDGKVHKYATGTGAETTTGGWPQVATLKPYDEKGSSDLTIATSGGQTYLYVANGGYPGDRGDYQGHVTTINLGTGTQKVFNTVCSNQTVHFTAPGQGPDCSEVQSAVWSRAGVVHDPATGLVYLVTGNATFDPARHHYGDTVIAINPDGSGAGAGNDPVDSYTPSNYVQLDQLDQDLGSSSPAVVSPPAGSPVANLGVQAGKDGVLRLLDLARLGGTRAAGTVGGELQTVAFPQGGPVALTQPTAWRDGAGRSWVFVANGRGLAALEVVLQNGQPRLVSRWTSTTGGTTPVVAGGVLYYETGSGLRALDPTTGTQLWTDGVSTGVHWQSPIVTADAVYYPTDDGKLYGYRLPTGEPVASTVTVSTTPNTAVGVAAVGLFADVTPGSATGSVGFRVDGAAVPGCEARPVVGGRASCATTFATAGAHTVTAAYSGDATTGPSSGTATVDVAPGASFPQLLLGFLLAFARAVHVFGF
ncbi:hypothetical protein GCM10027047_04880 [Rhodococcus aerolatus]